MLIIRYNKISYRDYPAGCDSPCAQSAGPDQLVPLEVSADPLTAIFLY